MTDALDVYLYGQRVARISRRGDNLHLRYTPEYVESERAVPISVQLKRLKFSAAVMRVAAAR